MLCDTSTTSVDILRQSHVDIVRFGPLHIAVSLTVLKRVY